MHTIRTINAFICINNHANLCIKCMLSVGYQAFTLDKFEPLIAFLSPQIAAVKALRSNFSKTQETYIKCPSLFSLLSPRLPLSLSLYCLLAKKWKPRKKCRTRMTEMVRVEEKEERRGKRKRSEREGSEFSLQRK